MANVRINVQRGELPHAPILSSPYDWYGLLAEIRDLRLAVGMWNHAYKYGKWVEFKRAPSPGKSAFVTPGIVRLGWFEVTWLWLS